MANMENRLNLSQLVKEADAFYQEFQEKVQGKLKEAFAEIFATIPSLAEISWVQTAPTNMDGDPYDFSVRPPVFRSFDHLERSWEWDDNGFEITVGLNFKGTLYVKEGEFYFPEWLRTSSQKEENYEELQSIAEAMGIGGKELSIMRELSDALQSEALSHALRNAFGEDTQTTIYRDGRVESEVIDCW